jgi:DNA excision repair protein ERCC-2
VGTTTGYERFFPYEEPYPNQREAMDRIANALARGQDVLMEGAPGTGKTLSALVPALDYAREHDKTVVITTNVHQQMRQFVADSRAINREEPIRAVVFRGKTSMCHIDVGYEECQALRDATRDLVDTEQEAAELRQQASNLLDRMQAGEDGAAEARQAVTDELERVETELSELKDGNVCEYYHRNLAEETDEFFAWLFDDVRTPDQVFEYAERHGWCGYELLKEGMDRVDLVVANYHHLLNPTIREQFFRWLDCDPGEVITVFDEAHNIEDAARDHASRTLTENTVESALSELEESDDSRAEPARNVVSAFHRALRKTYRDALRPGERERVGENWVDVTVANDDRRDDLTLAFLEAYEGPGIAADVEDATKLGRALDEQYADAYRNGESTTRTECQTLAVAQFIDSWMEEGADLGQYPVVSVRRDGGTDELYGRAELYTCIPRQVTRELFEEVHTSILMSATLRPFDVTEAVLGLSNPATLAYGLEYPEDNRRTFAVETPPLFKSERDDPETQADVQSLLADVVRFTPGNTLLYFPSYAEAERYHDRLRQDVTAVGGSDLYLDQPGTRAEQLRQTFVSADDAALFTSLWGTLTEGVSFDGDDARTVVVVGVPYPHLSDRMAAVQDAYDRTFGDRGGDAGWRYAVEIPTIRKTRQAIGRVIRAPDDFGVRVLVDKRYTSASKEMGKYGVRHTFPPEEERELIDIAPEKLKFAMLNFYSDQGAYDGAPPQP